MFYLKNKCDNIFQELITYEPSIGDAKVYVDNGSSV